MVQGFNNKIAISEYTIIMDNKQVVYKKEEKNSISGEYSFVPTGNLKIVNNPKIQVDTNYNILYQYDVISITTQ